LRRRLLGLPSDPRYADPEAVRADLLKHVSEIETQVAHAAVVAAQENPGFADKGILEFDFEGESWWVAVKPYPLQQDRSLRIAILIPASDLVGEITQLRIGLMISTLVALSAALIFALFLTRSYSRPLEALAAQSRRLRDLDFGVIEPIEANVLEVRELAETQAQSLAAVESFSRYVPVEVVRELLAEGDVARIGGQSREMTLLFSDIADFTRISEGLLDPQALADHMAGYFDELIDIIQANGGTVDKLVGDAIVAFWGAPHADAEHPRWPAATGSRCSTPSGRRRAGPRWSPGSGSPVARSSSATLAPPTVSRTRCSATRSISPAASRGSTRRTAATCLPPRPRSRPAARPLPGVASIASS
jgi:class 3 adenylate cyclase